MCIRFLQMLIASVLCMGTFVYGEEVIELEFGNEAYEEFMSYVLDQGYDYEVGHRDILEIKEGILYPITFGDSYLTVYKDGQQVKKIEVIVYFVGNEQTPFSPATVNKAFLSGYPDGTFKPDQYMTRAELASILTEILPLETNENLVYDDLIGHWAHDAMLLCIQNGFFNGTDIAPDDLITTREMSEVVYTFSKIKKLETSLNATDYCISNGLMTQVDDQTFLSRGQMVKIINTITCRKQVLTDKIFIDVPLGHINYYEIHGSAK